MQQRSTILDGHRVAYETRGEGLPAVVFVHGASADGSHWHHQMNGLATDGRLVAVDLPGHGASDKPEIAYSMDLFVESVAAVLDDLGIRQAFVVGHSNGVAVARQFHRRHPDRIQALVFVDGPLTPIPRERAEWMLAMMRRPDYDVVMKGLMEQMPRGRLSDSDLAIVRRTALATPRHVMAGMHEALIDERIWEPDPIGVPLLMLSAQPLSGQQRELVRRIAPQAEIHEWEDASHFVIMEQAPRLNALLVDFIDRTA